MQLCAINDTLTFHEAAVMVRDEHRLTGRPLATRNVGSTLLLKGLEAEAAVIFNADGLDARNLYVAMTRGSMALTICSSKATLARAKPT
jgi:DNA helicase-2/ATP-dependent DNA helicase PcrA